MEQKYADMLTKLQSDLNHIKFDVNKIIDAFDDYEFKTIQNLKKNHSMFSEKEWNEIYQKNEDNYNIILSMIKYPECPVAILEDIVSNVFKKSFSFLDDCFETKILYRMLSTNISEQTFCEIFDLAPQHFLTEIKSAFNSPPSQKAIHAFAKYILENPENFHGDNAYNKTETAGVFDLIKDKDFFYDICEKFLLINGYSHIKTVLINNPLLDINNPKDENMINSLFSDDGYCEYVKKFTPLIKDFFVKNFTDIDNYSDDEIYEKQPFIEHLISSDINTDALEYDLIMKILNHPHLSHMKNLNALKSYILINTKAENLMPIIESLPMKDRRLILQYNKTLPQSVYANVVHDICNKIRKNTKNDHREKNSSIWYDDIEDYCKKATFLDEDYDFLIKNYNNEKRMILNIARSPYTPEKYLNLLIEVMEKNFETNYPNYNAMNTTVYTSTKLNLLFKNNLINEKQLDALARLTSAHNSKIFLSDEEFKDIVNNDTVIKPCAHFFNKLIESSTAEEMNDFRLVLKDIFKSDDKIKKETTPSLKNLSYLINCSFEQATLIYGPDSIKHVSENTLNWQMEAIYIEIVNLMRKSMINLSEFYEMCPEFYDRYIAIAEEKEKRKNIDKEDLER